MAQGNDLAKRLDPDFGPFAAAMDRGDAARSALATLTHGTQELWLLGSDADTPIVGADLVRTATLAQMMATQVTPDPRGPVDWIELTEADAPDIHALSRLTRPGPLRQFTHRLGRFIGIRMDGQLVAMAGERMRLPGYTEVSGVCTHPDWRGRGYAGSLMRLVMRHIMDMGQTPFLHAYADHDKTIALYRTLGFDVRAQMPMMIIKRDAA